MCDIWEFLTHMNKELRTTLYEMSYSAFQLSVAWIIRFLMWNIKVILWKIMFPHFKTPNPFFLSHDHYNFRVFFLKILERASSSLPLLLVNYVDEHFYITSSVSSSHIPTYCPKLAVFKCEISKSVISNSFPLNDAEFQGGN